MLFSEFREKLIPFFTPVQIGNLDASAAESALYCLGRPRTVDEMAANIDAGRDVVCNLIADYIESEPDCITRMAGSPIPDDARARLIAQMDVEW